MIDESLHEIHQSRAEQYEILFFCALAAWCFGLSLYYWVRIAGLFPDENWRFDLMSWHWRALSAGMAVLYPVSACGLWLQSRWGLILWLAGAGLETFCYIFIKSLFGLNWWLPLLHIILVCIYVAILVYRHRFTQAQEQPIIAEY